jgi:hypothetical protein
MRHEPARMIDQVSEHRKRLWHERDAGVAAPEALVRFVESKGLKRFHLRVASVAAHSSIAVNAVGAILPCRSVTKNVVDERDCELP